MSAVLLPSTAPTFDLQQVVSELAAVRQRWRKAQQRSTEPGGRELPSRDALTHIVDGLRGALFPMRLGPPDLRQESEDFYVGHTLDAVLHALLHQVQLELFHTHRLTAHLNDEAIQQQALQIVRDFAHSLPQIRELLDSDVTAAFAGDPAARSVDEVLLCYPGIEGMFTTVWPIACMYWVCRCWLVWSLNWRMAKRAWTFILVPPLAQVFSSIMAPVW
jgi:serine O-acetyltransferase